MSPADARAELDKLQHAFNGDDYLRVVRACDAKAVQLYLAAGMSPSAENQLSYPPLNAAADARCREVLHVLLDAGVAPDEHTLFGAAWAGFDDVVARVLDKGVDVNARKGSADPTALHGAAAEGHLATAKLLVSRGADLTAKMSWERTPSDRALEAAALGNDAEALVLELLLSKGAPLPGRDPSSRDYPLMIAARGKSAAAVRALLAAGVSVNEISISGMTALDIARVNANVPANIDIIDAIEKAGGKTARELKGPSGT